MSQFKFKYISYTDILESAKWKHMIDAIEQSIDENLLVNWLPWCGKSTIATHRLDKLKNKNGLLLTFWNLLTSYLSQSLKDNLSKTKVQAFWKWFYAMRRKVWLDHIDIKNINWDVIKDTFEKIAENQWKYDFLFIDEWQDLPKELYPLLNIISNHLSVFADDAQQLYWNWKNANLNDIINWIDPIQFELNINRRNPKQMYEFAYQFNPTHAEKWNLKLMTNKSDSVEVYNCNTKENELNKIIELLEEYEWKNIAILFSNQDAIDEYKIELEKHDIKFTIYHSNNNKLDNFNSPLLTTFHSVKWLEFPIVIIPWLYPEHKWKFITNNHFFVAITRASEKLIITHHNWGSEIEDKIKNIDSNLYEEYKIWKIVEKEMSLDEIPF